MERKGPKRLTIDITEQEHADIKAYAASRNISIKKWVMRAILRQVEYENKFKTKE